VLGKNLTVRTRHRLNSRHDVDFQGDWYTDENAVDLETNAL
jgi:hypothetical protein